MIVAEKKSFGVALLVWFFLGGLGGHRIYIKEKISIVFWYWLVSVCTLGILPIVDLFLIKGMIKEAHENEIIRSKALNQ